MAQKITKEILSALDWENFSSSEYFYLVSSENTEGVHFEILYGWADGTFAGELYHDVGEHSFNAAGLLGTGKWDTANDCPKDITEPWYYEADVVDWLKEYFADGFEEFKELGDGLLYEKSSS